MHVSGLAKEFNLPNKILKSKKITTGRQFSQVQQAMIEEEKWAAPSMTYFRPHFMVSAITNTIVIDTTAPNTIVTNSIVTTPLSSKSSS